MESTALQSQESWNNVWNQTDLQEGYGFLPSRYLRAADKIGYWLQRGLDFKSKEKVLEAGCGDGMILIRLMKLFDVDGYGIDFSSTALRQAQELSFKERVFPQLDCADTRSIPHASNFFDKVISLGVVEHMKDMRPSFAELKRVLKPGGLLILMTPNRRSVGRWQRRWMSILGLWRMGFQDEYNPEQLSEYARNAGLIVLDLDVVERRKLKFETRSLKCIRLVDHLLGCFLPSWGFYSYIYATKKES